ISTEQLGWIIAYMKTLSEATPEAELAATQVDPDAEAAEEGAEGGEGAAEPATDTGGMMEGTPGDG
ncbi:MAG: hypothetical protein AAFV77_13380, partial [Planctomycetota bacterium]